MNSWLSQVSRRAVIVGALLTAIGAGACLLLRYALRSMGVETEANSAPLVLGLILGVSGAVLVVIFELFAAGWNKLRGGKPPQSPPVESLP